MRRRMQRGVAIEYVMITMALVAGLVAALLTAASLTAQTARKERDYIEEKYFLDSAARTFIEDAQGGKLSAGALQDELNENDYGYEFQVSGYELIATQNRSVAVYVRLADDDLRVIAYRYRYI